MFVKLKFNVRNRNLKTSFLLEYTSNDGLCSVFGNKETLTMPYQVAKQSRI